MSSILILLCVSCFVLVASVPKQAPTYAPEDAEFHFEEFIKKFEKIYVDENEKQMRFQIFKDRLVKINELNEMSDHAVFGITYFSDMSHEEFSRIHSCLESSPISFDKDSGCKYLTDKDITYTDAPESFDWRDHNVVTEVKDQLDCGSCYAFSTIGNIEGQYAIKHKKLVDLSEQQIVDCDKGNGACNGGFMSVAMRSLIKQGGSESEKDYPYKGISNKCQFDENKVTVKLQDCHSYNLTSQEKLKQLLYHNGPISIGVQAFALLQYTKGIIPDKICNLGPVNHGVLLVGYGAENSTPFWIVKNSWNADFGEKGYFRIHRGEKALSCNMMNDKMASAVVE